jgi:hypothetical protein
MGRAISTMYLVCPFCGKHLRTERAHAGREGLCPECEKIFELPELQAPPEHADEAPEYDSTVVLTLAGGVGLGLLFLASSALLDWSRPGGAEALFFGAQKLAMVVGSLACLVVIFVALAGRKSLMPPVLVSGAWGMTAAVWIAGSSVVLGRVVGSLQESPARPGMHVALLAACVVVATSGYLTLQLRNEKLFRGLGAVYGALQVAGVLAGLLIVGFYVSPGLRAHAADTRGTHAQQNAPLYVAPTAHDANLAVENPEWPPGDRMRRGSD